MAKPAGAVRGGKPPPRPSRARPTPSPKGFHPLKPPATDPSRSGWSLRETWEDHQA